MARIIVADDEEHVRDFVCEALLEDGHDIVRAENGEQVLQLLHEHTVDLIVTDMSMPEVGGIELIRRLNKQFPDTKIIAFSGGGEFIEADMYLRIADVLGAKSILKKPIAPVKLRVAVARALHGQSE